MSDRQYLLTLKKQVREYKYFAVNCKDGFLFADELVSLKNEVKELSKRLKMQKAIKLLKKKGFTILSTSGLPLL